MSEKNGELKKGADSGDPSPKVKLHVAFNSGGKCYFPGCTMHLTLEGTNIGECAHIIPKKVGFVREDWQTPLADRKKAANLIYMCPIHHAVIDDLDNAAKYPASELFSWKKTHEATVLSQDKDASDIPESVKKRLEETISTLSAELTNEINISVQLLSQLLSECRTLLRRWYLDKAEVLLSQVEMLLSDIENSELNSELKALKANLTWKRGRIPDAKAMYIELLETSSHLDGMLDYIELCRAVPEEGDRGEEFEEKAKEIYSTHPRLVLIELLQKLQQDENLQHEIVETKWADDVWLNGQFYLTYALFLNCSGDLEKRDHFIAQWEKQAPHSPRPIFFRALFIAADAQRHGIGNHEEAVALLREIKSQEEMFGAKGKDPLNTRDQITLLVTKIRVLAAILHLSAEDSNELRETKDRLLALVNDQYFDKQIDHSLSEALSVVQLDLSQWEELVSNINSTRVVPAKDLIDLLFLQGINLGVDPDELRNFVAGFSRDDLSDLLKALAQQDATEIVRAIEGRDTKFKIILFQSINDVGLRTKVIDSTELPEEAEIDKLFFKIEANASEGNGAKALELAKQVRLEDVSPQFLRLINDVAYKHGDHKLVIKSAERLLSLDLNIDFKTELQGRIATAYSRCDDDKNAYEYANRALGRSDFLGVENTRTLVFIAINSLLTLDKIDETSSFVERHFEKIEDTPELGLFFADAVLKSSQDNKVDLAIRCVTEAISHASSNDDRIFLSAFMVLIELSNLGAISNKSKDKVDVGDFVKIEGLDDTWFYMGDEEKAFAAKALDATDSRYQAIIGSPLGAEIDWPADKYSSSKKSKKVAHILERDRYFYVKSHEVMQATAEKGDAAIWTVEVLNEDGSLNQKNLLRFHEEQSRGQNQFFESYCSNPLPFSMLCRSEGSLHQALGKICSEDRGVVRCNNGTEQNQQEQNQVANQILAGKSFFIDSLSALMLAETELLQTVVESLPNIHIATSVIKTLRDIAETLRASTSLGRMGFVGGRIHVTERNHELESEFRQKVIAAADILDNLPNRLVGNTYEKVSGSELSLDSIFPSWMADTVRLAQEMGCAVVTDDVLALQAYSIKEQNIPSGTSSLSLVRCLHENGFLSWEEYLGYFRILSSHRYHHLPISVDDMEKSVLGVSKGGLVLFTPMNIDKLNIAQTFSSEFGVQDQTAIRVASVFFSKIIMRDDVTEDMSEQIFSRVLVGILAKRDAKIWGKVIINLCNQALEQHFLPSALAWKKLSLLEQQISSYSHEYNPIIQSVPSLLIVGKKNN